MTDTRFRLDIDIEHLGVRETVKRILDRSDDLGRANLENVLVELVDAAHLTAYPAKIAGYTPQPDAKVALVNELKADEERLLRKLDAMMVGKVDSKGRPVPGTADSDINPLTPYDKRWLAIARTHFQEGFSAMVRAVFQPTRIKLPEDGE